MMRLFITLLCALHFALPTASAQSQYVPEIEKGSPIRIEVQPVFTENIAFGVPYRVTIWNNSTRPGQWQLTQSVSRYRRMFNSSFVDRETFQVGPQETRTFNVVLQLPKNDSYYYNGQLACEGTGVAADASNFSISMGRNDRASFAASNDLELPLLAPYRDRFTKLKRPALIPTFAPSNLIPDWRAYGGFSRLVFSEKAWTQQINGEVRNAIRQWVATGGALYIVTEAEHTPIWNGISLKKDQPQSEYYYGSGTITRLDQKATEANVELLSKELTIADKSSIKPESAALKDAAAFIMVFTLVFAIVIAPVNLFFLAPAHRRQKLFFTIPAISIIGTVCLILFIVLKDGIGGTGERYAVIRLLPESHEANVVQLQAATTGMLLGSDFRLDDPTAVLQSTNEQEESSLREGVNYSGGWFRSRAEQGHRLSSIRSSRMGIEQVNTGGPPEIISSIEGSLKLLILSDNDGKYWGAENVATGQKTTLRPIEAIKRSEAINLAAYAGTLYGTRLLNDLLPSGSGSSLQLRSGAFVAIPADPAPFLIDTLSSIRWNNTAVIAGTYTLSHTTAR